MTDVRACLQSCVTPQCRTGSSRQLHERLVGNHASALPKRYGAVATASMRGSSGSIRDTSTSRVAGGPAECDGSLSESRTATGRAGAVLGRCVRTARSLNFHSARGRRAPGHFAPIPAGPRHPWRLALSSRPHLTSAVQKSPAGPDSLDWYASHCPSGETSPFRACSVGGRTNNGCSAWSLSNVTVNRPRDVSQNTTRFPPGRTDVGN